MRQKNSKQTLSKKRKRTEKMYLYLSIVFILAFVLFYDYISFFFFNGDQSPRGELLKVALTFIAGLIAILVWRNSVKRVRTMEKQVLIMEEGNLETRFNNAVGYFGSKDPAIVLGGIHALYQIAMKHKNYTKAVHDLFCIYLQEKSADLYKDIDEDSRRCPPIIQNLVNYLFKQSNDKKNIFKEMEPSIKPDLQFATLKNVNFDNLILTDCWISKATLTNCKFSNTILIDCRIYSSTELKNCEFYDGTTLTNCSFWRGATLMNCKFFRRAKSEQRRQYEGAKLEGCNFYDETTFTNCDFAKASLINCDFSGEFFDSPYTSALFDEDTKNSLINHTSLMDVSTKCSLNKVRIKK